MSALPSDSTKRELSALATLATPLVIANLGNVLIGAVDSAVVGRLGGDELAGVGLGNALYFLLMIIGVGVGLGLDPLISQAIGAGEHRRARRLFWQGVWVALLVGLPLTAITGLALLGLPWTGADPDATVHTVPYVLTRLPALVPTLVFYAARSYLQAVAVTRPMIWAVVLANLVNLVASWFLVLGDDGLARIGMAGVGFSGWGVAGAGWASTLAMLVQMGVLVWAMRAVPFPGGRLETLGPVRRDMRRVLHIGVPLGLQLAVEGGVFSMVALLAATLGAGPLAAHHVAMTVASATFMVPLGIGTAAAVRVGHAVGRADVPGTRLAGLLALGLATVFALLSAAGFALFPEELSAIFSDKQSVISAAAPLILVAAVFQMADGIQNVAGGALRGAGDTRALLWANAVGHWLIGLPIGLALVYWVGVGVVGFWWGLCVGLSAVSIVLTWRFMALSGKPIARV